MANNSWLTGGSIVHAIAVWVAFFVLYLLFAGTEKPAELVGGGFSAGLAAAFEAAVRVRSERSLNLTLPMLWPLLPGLGQLVPDTFRVGGALLSALHAAPSGKLCAVPAPAGTGCASAAAHGVAIIAASLAPNAFVLGGRPENGRFIVHRLVG